MALVVGVRRWARSLHGGQLVMVLFFGVPAGVISGGVGWTLTERADSAAEEIAREEYAESPRVVVLAGEPYRLRRAPKPDRLPVLLRWADSLQEAGAQDFEISQALQRFDIADPVYVVSPLRELNDRAALKIWGWLLSGAGLALVGFCVWTLWTWLGSRARRVEAS